MDAFIAICDEFPGLSAFGESREGDRSYGSLVEHPIKNFIYISQIVFQVKDAGDFFIREMRRNVRVVFYQFVVIAALVPNFHRISLGENISVFT